MRSTLAAALATTALVAALTGCSGGGADGGDGGGGADAPAADAGTTAVAGEAEYAYSGASGKAEVKVHELKVRGDLMQLTLTVTGQKGDDMEADLTKENLYTLYGTYGLLPSAVDTSNLKRHEVVNDTEDEPLMPDSVGTYLTFGEPHELSYTFAAPPKDVTTMDVYVNEYPPVTDVPVVPVTPRGAVGVLAALLLIGPLATAAGGPVDDPGRPVDDAAVDASIGSLSPEEHVFALDLDASIVPLEEERVENGTTTVTISADVLFDFDEASLTKGSKDSIADIADRLTGVGGTVRIVGHSDAIGDPGYNQKLSERRADAVLGALEDELGSGAPDMEASGKGSAEPVAEEKTGEGDDDPSGRAKNRRVEITFDGA